MANLAQRNFGAGELAPALYGRTDQQRYATGLRVCRNFMVLRSGGVANRPGTAFVAAVKDPTVRPRLLPFVYNAEQTYVLEFGERYLRVLHEGAPVVATGAAAWLTGTAYALADLVAHGGVTYVCILAHTAGSASEPGTGTAWQTSWHALVDDVYEIPTPYLAADLFRIQCVQSGDVMTLVHPSYAPRELARTGHTAWTLSVIRFEPSIAPPNSLAVTGGAVGAARTWAVTAIDRVTREESLPATITETDVLPSEATPATVAWAIAAGADEYKVYRSVDGATFGFIGSSGGTPTPASASAWSTPSASVNTTTRDVFVPAGAGAAITPVAVAADRAYDGTYLVSGTLTTSATGASVTSAQGQLRAYYSRDGEPPVDAGLVGEASHFLSGEGTVGPTDFEDVIIVPDNGYATLELTLVPEVRGKSGVFGPTFDCEVVGTAVEWSTGSSQFEDAGAVPDFSVVPPKPATVFQTSDAYPSAVTYYQQRRLFGNTTNEPEKVWASRTGHYRNFSRSTPLQDDDPVSWSLAGRQVNAVRHLLDLGVLVCFTAAGEWAITGDEAGALTPAAVNPRQYSANGANGMPPLVVGASALYVQARGTVVRDLAPVSTDGYEGTDLTVFASHLFDRYELEDWAYQQIPHSIVWAVRSDGVLLGLTYRKEHAMWGWHQHVTDGLVEAVCVVPEGAEDRLYLVVQRTIGGAAVRYIERLASRRFVTTTDAFFVDAGLTYDGRNTGATTMTLSGGASWDAGEPLTLTASAATFLASHVGDRVDLTAADGTAIRCAIEGYTSATVVTVRPNRLVPADLRAAATTAWALAVSTFAGLDHLEGKAVAIFADGFVVASPNNTSYAAAVVAGGAVTLPEPYAHAHIGLPYLADVETLDLDTASGPSLKDRRMLVNRVGLLIDEARGLWVGADAPADDATDPLDGLSEVKRRDAEPYDAPIALAAADVDVNIDASWNSNGRIFVRQVDPLPVTILAAIPQGHLP